MRTIKFRGKSALNGKWLFGYLSWYQEEDSDRFINGELIDSETLGQFIGLHDIEGKEIYEGDIIEYTKGDVRLLHKPFVVLYNEDYAYFEYKDQKGNTYSISKAGVKRFGIKVIGNIYETV